MFSSIFFIIGSVVLVMVTAAFFIFFVMNKKRGAGNKDYYSASIVKKENLGARLRKIFGGKVLSGEELNSLEETLIQADIGQALSADVISKLKSRNIGNIDGAIDILKKDLLEIIEEKKYDLKPDVLNIILVLGVNGVGKTTSIAKIANHYVGKGKKVLLAAGDTFRAAATEQLTRWANRINIPIIKQGEGADPASVVFDAVDSAKSKGVDLLIIDTAGRLHNKKHLMEELMKIDRIINSKGSFTKSNLLVIDSTMGQNAIHQAEAFNESVGVDMIMLTKYDADTKGGVIFNIARKFKIPFSFIGVGEKIEDIEVFESEKFVDKIFS